MKSNIDLRQQIEDHPALLIGILGGGVLLAAAAASYSRRNVSSSNALAAPHQPRQLSPTMQKTARAWENVKGALLGLAITRFRNYADEILPGFSEHYQRTASERDR